LLDSLQCSCRVKNRLSFLVDYIRATEFFVRQFPLQIGAHDAARMEGEGPHALCLATFTKGDREQDVLCLGLAIGREAAIFAAPVGGGPSGNTCPWWLPQRAQRSSVRAMP
jgi:hypothetical protein